MTPYSVSREISLNEIESTGATVLPLINTSDQMYYGIPGRVPIEILTGEYLVTYHGGINAFGMFYEEFARTGDVEKSFEIAHGITIAQFIMEFDAWQTAGFPESGE